MTKEPIIDRRKRTKQISSLVFYTETLRLVKFYLRTFSFESSGEALRHFIASQINKKQSLTESSNEITPNTGSNNISPPDYDSNASGGYGRNGCFVSLNDDPRGEFLEEMRILVLSLIPAVEKESKNTLQIYHLFLHLLELLLDHRKFKHKKISEFLNTNFSLDSDDLIGHACRGNYGMLINMKPELGPFLEELQVHGRIGSEALQRKYGISDALMNIVTGKFTDFRNTLEEDCYFIFHNIRSESSSELLKVFDGKLEIFLHHDDSFLRLMFLLAYPGAKLRDVEKCFEELFFETFDDDYLMGLEFLAFSRKCHFYFEYLVEKIPLNCVAIESLIKFSTRNNLKKDLMMSNFGYYMQEQMDYDQLCRFILTNKIRSFKYEKKFMEYFIDNFDRFRFFVTDEMSEDCAIQFINNMSNISFADEHALQCIFTSEYFFTFVDRIINSLSLRDDLGEQLIWELINKLFENEKQFGVPLKKYKAILAKKFIK